ncbi:MULTISPECIES: hypothetical protein [Photorhabdus]|uniref:Uncharacterized protein n=3 Tax=Photorhabdus TaxID=29487 RepID=A0A0F7LTA0_9GAMM|nr:MULTISPECIES: hypothetical protein [Photorhabdus]AKH64997.1 hypothetical protein VY86_18280 [Photorhabdus thracensis]EQC01888.1 hypothetical protein B738_01344 [Photorhabdus temperata subsp. temperata M1021]ERT12416.1 hypothetical protein O185_14360 [Photorhabdus temperata J3]KER03945.1 hypothetical protein MEG1DRAFT_01359 [Photorhabdus temperata subsp. temperata Meg1]MCC8422593.1 hypothetical protein [Photorhabdus thracensis]
MLVRKSLLALFATASLTAAGVVYAGPPVTVTFKHLGASGSADAVYTIITNNEVSTNVNATPKPRVRVRQGESDSYQVQSPITPDGNYAIVRYEIGNKTCVFSTTFINTYVNGVKIPKWNKGATPSGGAVCNATITSTNFLTYAWSVEFTMK